MDRENLGDETFGGSESGGGEDRQNAGPSDIAETGQIPTHEHFHETTGHEAGEIPRNLERRVEYFITEFPIPITSIRL